MDVSSDDMLYRPQTSRPRYLAAQEAGRFSVGDQRGLQRKITGGLPKVSILNKLSGE